MAEAIPCNVLHVLYVPAQRQAETDVQMPLHHQICAAVTICRIYNGKEI